MATGMAVGLDNFYLNNNSLSSYQVQIGNLEESHSYFQVVPHSICRVPGPIGFLPVAAENNNFVIKVVVDHNNDPIVIDQFGLLTLAADAITKFPYSGKVKYYGLYGFCGDQLAQSKFLKVFSAPNAHAAPSFLLVNCAKSSNFVYLINDKYIKIARKHKRINFKQIPWCKPQGLSNQESAAALEMSIFDAYSK